MREKGWTTIEMDILRSASDDLSSQEKRDRIMTDLANGVYDALAASPPCDTFSRVKFANRFGPQPVRTATDLEGFKWLKGEKKRITDIGTVLAKFTLKAATVQAKTSPGIVLLEFPEDLGAVQHGEWKGTHPGSLWQFPQMESLRQVCGVKEYGIHQHNFGANHLKPTRLVLKGTPSDGILHEGPPIFDREGFYVGPIPRLNAAALGLRTLAKTSSDAEFRTSGTAAWPTGLCRWAADSIHNTWLVSDHTVRGTLPGSCDEETFNPKQKSYPVYMPPTGWWQGGRGPPRQTYMLGKTAEFHDGAGLTSPGRWKPEDRCYPEGKRWDILRDRLYKTLLDCKNEKGQPWGTQGIQKAFLLLGSSKEVEVFDNELLKQGLEVIRSWLRTQCGDFNELEVEIPANQPFNLKFIHLLLREMRDADYEIMDTLKTGVTAGILHPLPRNPVMLEEQTKWRPPEHPWNDRIGETGNYCSLEKFKVQVKELFQEEEKVGLMKEMTDEEFFCKFPKNHAISALAVIEEEGGRKIRVLHDGTHKTCINNRIRQRDKLRMPGVAEKHCVMRERRKKAQIVFSLLGDFTKAHRWPKIIEEEHGMLACRVEPGQVWVNHGGTFGITSAAYWWSRLAGGLVRLAHGVLGKWWPIELLLYADDVEATAANASEREGVVLLFFLLRVLGSPFKNRKFRGGFQADWVGLHIDNVRFGMGLSVARAEWLVGWLRHSAGLKTIEVTNFSGGLGRLNFAATALFYEKPWLGPLYGWISVIMQTGRSTATLPWGIKFILHFLADKIEKSDRVMTVPELPNTSRDQFLTDAKAENGKATIGGWYCGTEDEPKLPKDAPWYFLEVDKTNFPWAFAKGGGDPQRVIATLELMGTVTALIAFDIKATSLTKTTVTISAGTDNQGCSLALKKLMSTKWPLAPLLMELSEQMRSRSLELQLNWVPRNENTLADSITNGDFAQFDERNRIHIDAANLGWKILDKAMEWSKMIYDETNSAKATNKRTNTAGEAEQTKRRRTAAAKRLRTADPW